MGSSPRHHDNDPQTLETDPIDSAEINEEKQRKRKKHRTSLPRIIFHSFLAIISSVFIFLFISFSILYLAVFVGDLSIRSPISVPSHCRIVSSSVDLRSSKVCELGLLNYKAKNVFYPFERKKYRCHYDYYWASVFKVEYVDHSGQVRHALAEAPNEALPTDCRPNFGAAWLTKDKFKVNETYDCWYTMGISKVNINHEGLFDCQANDPSTVEMFKRYSILFTRILRSRLFDWESMKRWRWDVIAGLVTGFMASLLSITFVGLLASFMSVICRFCAARMSAMLPGIILLKRTCWFVLYFSFMGWITIQYLKRLGLYHI